MSVFILSLTTAGGGGGGAAFDDEIKFVFPKVKDTSRTFNETITLPLPLGGTAAIRSMKFVIKNNHGELGGFTSPDVLKGGSMLSANWSLLMPPNSSVRYNP